MKSCLTTLQTSKCNLCQASVPRKDGSTTGMVIHLKRHHGFLKKHNAYKTYEELSVLKDNCLKAKKRKLEQPEQLEPKTKQPKVEDAINSKYPPNHPRQIKINNAIAAAMCVDAMPANSANRPGFKLSPFHLTDLTAMM